MILYNDEESSFCSEAGLAYLPALSLVVGYWRSYLILLGFIRILMHLKNDSEHILNQHSAGNKIL